MFVIATEVTLREPNPILKVQARMFAFGETELDHWRRTGSLLEPPSDPVNHRMATEPYTVFFFIRDF